MLPLSTGQLWRFVKVPLLLLLGLLAVCISAAVDSGDKSSMADGKAAAPKAHHPQLSISHLAVAVGDVTETLSLGEKLKSIGSLDEQKPLKMVFQLDNKTEQGKLPNQVNLMLKSASSRSFLPFECDSERAQCRLLLDLGNNVRRIYPGKYFATLLVAGSPSMQPVKWELGLMHLTHSKPVVPAVLNEGEDWFSVKPDIAYSFRPKEKSTMVVAPLLGAALVLLPWVFLFRSWRSLGISFMPSADLFSLQSIYLPAFMASIGCLFLLCLASWIWLPLFHTIGYMSIIGSLSSLIGLKALQSIVSKRPNEKTE